jgi:hypothetical protein
VICPLSNCTTTRFFVKLAGHPALRRAVRLALRTRELRCLDYDAAANPPILNRKETLLHPDHPVHGKFARLTAQEEQPGLPDETASIGTSAG